MKKKTSAQSHQLQEIPEHRASNGTQILLGTADKLKNKQTKVNTSNKTITRRWVKWQS